MDKLNIDWDKGFRIGEWTVLPRQSGLRKSDDIVHIEPKVMGVLVCLARHAPETVTRDELLDEVWAGVIVQDEALNRNISILRSELDKPDRKYIQTVPRVGYRLLEDVGPIEMQALIESRPPRRVIGAAIVAMILLAITLTQFGDRSEKNDFGFSIADLTEPVEAPRDLDSALRTTRLNSQILMLGDDRMLKRGAKHLRDSIRLFEESLKNDDEQIEAHLGLAKAYALLPSYESDPDRAIMYARAKAQLQAVVELGGEIEGTFATEAFIHLREMAWIKAEQKFRQAIEYDPDDAHLRQWYSQFLNRAGFTRASIDQAKISLQLDGDSPVAHHRLGASYTWAGENELAEEQFNLAIEMGIAPYTFKEPKIMLLKRAGKLEEMAALISALQESQFQDQDWVPQLIEVMRNPDSSSAAQLFNATENAWREGKLSASFYFGIPMLLDEPKKTLAVLNALLSDGSLTEIVEALFLPEMRRLRAEPGFLTLVREIGLVTFWAEYGLPDVCRDEHPEIAFCQHLETIVH